MKLDQFHQKIMTYKLALSRNMRSVPFLLGLMLYIIIVWHFGSFQLHSLSLQLLLLLPVHFFKTLADP